MKVIEIIIIWFLLVAVSCTKNANCMEANSSVRKGQNVEEKTDTIPLPNFIWNRTLISIHGIPNFSTEAQ